MPSGSHRSSRRSTRRTRDSVAKGGTTNAASSAARAIYAGAPYIERVDMLVQLIGGRLGMQNDAVDATVDLVSRKLAANRENA